jgi:hypothetical protein
VVALWPVYFASSVCFLVLAARWWTRIDGNRLITTGYPRLERRVRSSKWNAGNL